MGEEGFDKLMTQIQRRDRELASKRFAKVVYFNELTKGGHFAAFEQPEIFIREVRNCFRLIR
jgi:epoxide hydrolase